jgi:hypothetical protein
MSWRVVFGAIVIAISVGCTGGSHHAVPPTTSQPVSSAPTPSSAVIPQAPLSARIELPSDTIEAGATVDAVVIVSNNTGAAISADACGTPFQVGLTNGQVQPMLFWLLCRQTLTIPIGESRWPTRVLTFDLGCVGTPTQWLPTCSGTSPRPLPPGLYAVSLFQNPLVVPTPTPPLVVRVVA